MISAADQKFLLHFKKCILLVQVDGRLQILLLSLEFLFGMLLAILCTILFVVVSVVASSEMNWASLALLVMCLTNRYEEAEGSSVLLHLLVSLSCLLTPRYWRCFLCTIPEATKRINNQEQMVNFLLNYVDMQVQVGYLQWMQCWRFVCKAGSPTGGAAWTVLILLWLSSLCVFISSHSSTMILAIGMYLAFAWVLVFLVLSCGCGGLFSCEEQKSWTGGIWLLGGVISC